MHLNDVNEESGSCCVCVAEACFVVYFGSDRRLRIGFLFPQPCFRGFWESVAKGNLADNLTDLPMVIQGSQIMDVIQSNQ